jgi:hypothetical protein
MHLYSLGWEISENSSISALVSSIIGYLVAIFMTGLRWIWIYNKSISTETTTD